MNFTRAYCASPACNPSRTAIMTGLAPHTSGVYSNYQDWREVITDPTSLGKYLRNHGYFSAGAGKIYHYHMVDPLCWDAYWPSQTKNMPAFENMYMMFDWASLDIDDAEMGDFKSVDYVAASAGELETGDRSRVCQASIVLAPATCTPRGPICSTR